MVEHGGMSLESLPLLILSDGKPGHVNQSIAFAKLLGLSYEVRQVSFRNRFCKAISYVLDSLDVKTTKLFRIEGNIPDCAAVVSAGSGTYYANKTLAAKLGVRSVAIMLPRSYRLNFDLIVAQRHDQPPVRDNILTLPVNLSCPVPQGLVKQQEGKTCVAIILGGSSRHFRMELSMLERQLEQIFGLFPDASFLVTTSRRTTPEVEELIEKKPFDFKIIASRDQVNPIADFMAISDYVFVTEDSTSMISEAVSFGHSNVEILPLTRESRDNKIMRMSEFLENEGYVHIFDGFYGKANRKFDLVSELKRVWP